MGAVGAHSIPCFREHLRVGGGCVAGRSALPRGPDKATIMRSLPFFLPVPSRGICSGCQLCEVFILHFSHVSQSLAPTEPIVEAE